MQQQVMKPLSRVVKEMRQRVFANCWHMAKSESAAMWKLYADRGIVLESTVKSLVASIDSRNQNMVLGRVRYIDYDKDIIPVVGYFGAFLTKRRSFEYEREVRVLLSGKDDDPIENGRYVGVSLDSLIKSIYVSPRSPEWLTDVVQGLCKKYNLHKKVCRSSLSSGPPY